MPEKAIEVYYKMVREKKLSGELITKATSEYCSI